MGICPNCGEWVDDGDTCMSCGGASGGHSAWEGPTLTYHTGKNLPGRWERDQIRLKDTKRFYEMELDRAREAPDIRYRIKIYNGHLTIMTSISDCPGNLEWRLRECLAQDMHFPMRT